MWIWSHRIRRWASWSKKRRSGQPGGYQTERRTNQLARIPLEERRSGASVSKFAEAGGCSSLREREFLDGLADLPQFCIRRNFFEHSRVGGSPASSFVCDWVL